VVTDAPQVNVYRNRNVLPRALVVPRAELMPREAMLPRLRDPAFDPRQLVLLEPGAAAAPAPAALSGEVLGMDYPNPNEVLLEVKASASGFLLLSDVFYPGWRAFIDGQEVPVLRANYLFRALALPPGNHRVRFVFRPTAWEVTLAISLLTWLAIAGVGSVAILRARGRRRVNQP